MKAYGHTKTLFIQAWKYKWSYKHDFCISCKNVSSKHKWKWLCTKCFDKNRREDSKRLFNLAKQNWKYYYKTRILMFLEKTEHKKKALNFTKEDQKIYQKEWYTINREAILLKWKADRMKKRWETVLIAFIKWKERYFPFTNITRPPMWHDMIEYREKDRQYILLRQFYNK